MEKKGETTKMRKIDLKPYFVEMVDEGGNKKPVEVKIKKNLADLLFLPDLKLDGRAHILQGRLADKVEFCLEDEILLDSAEWSKLVQACEMAKGLPRPFGELLKRVFDAPEVEVEEKRG